MNQKELAKEYPIALDVAKKLLARWERTLTSNRDWQLSKWVWDNDFEQFLFLFECAPNLLADRIQLHVHKPYLVVSPKWVAKFSTGIDDIDWQQPL